ncbi:glycosyltransferase [Gimesia maris]|uniref:glycosyltransferase n=1 Tax=Gimesia maris TaxID=122 RepID=UPI003A935832
MTNISVVLTERNVVSETFIAAHIERLSSVNCVIERLAGQPAVDGTLVLSQNLAARAYRKLSRAVRRASWCDEIDRGFVAAFERTGTEVVLAEYGTNGVEVMAACESQRVPLVVHFHGYDASRYDLLAAMRANYMRMFHVASACVVVSRVMEETLIKLGCPQDKLIYFPYGVDLGEEIERTQSAPGCDCISVGRFVEKKAPYLTLLAFAQVKRRVPDVRLTMVGDGPFLPVCKQMADALGLGNSVRFLGALPHWRVKAEMQRAKLFLQHSIVASDGDSEGTPVAVLEAGAMGVPVVSTMHAGVPDVVIHGETGLLSEERDVDTMAGNICSLLINPRRRKEMGRNAKAHVTRYYTLDKSIQRLQLVLEAAASGGSMAVARCEIERTLPGACDKIADCPS